MATKQDLRRATFTRLAGLCNKVAECHNANSETSKKALELRKELLAFIGPLYSFNTFIQVFPEKYWHLVRLFKYVIVLHSLLQLIAKLLALHCARHAGGIIF
jgi:hypothetical protein